MDTYPADIRTVLDVIGGRTEGILREELGISVISKSSELGTMQSMTLGPITSILGMNGPVDMLIAFTYDKELILRIFSAYTADVEIPEDEKDLYVEERACDIANMVVGNSTRDFQIKGKAISVSPPITLTEAKRLVRTRDTVFSSLILETKFGNLTINFIGPKALFDENLNYKGAGQ